MAISVGDALPDATFVTMGEDGPGPVALSSLTEGKKIILFGVPGAFTPTCHGNHLPGFIDNLSAFKDKGVDAIGVVSVNDVFVMNEWSQASSGKDKIHFLADGSADFTKAVGLDLDMSEFGMGVRSKRYSMVVEDGKVTALNIEESPKDATASGAAALLEQL